MFEDLKTRLKKMSNKKNKNPVASIFQNPGYVQDQEDRRVQILFLKLLMILAHADDSIDPAEMDLIKSLIYENCITEEEWREISFYGLHKASGEEVNEVIDALLAEIVSGKEKKKFLRAIRDIVEADDILQKEEKAIVDIFEKKLKSGSASIFGNVIKRIHSSLVRKKSDTIQDDSREYSMNPIAPHLRELLGDDRLPELELIAAKLGLAIILIHSDMEFHEKERSAFEDMVCRACSIPKERAGDVASELLNIPDTHFDIAYLGRIVTDSTDEAERKELLTELFRIARADKVYSPYENKYLKIIGSYLFISDRDFMAIKMSTKS